MPIGIIRPNVPTEATKLADRRDEIRRASPFKRGSYHQQELLSLYKTIRRRLGEATWKVAVQRS